MFGKKKKDPPELTRGEVVEVIAEESKSFLSNLLSGLWSVTKWTWKQWKKLPNKIRSWAYGILILCALVFIAVLFSNREEDDRVAPTWRWWSACIIEDWETGRETKYSLINNICYIESLTSTNEKQVWIRSKNDRGFGDGE